MPVPQIDFDKAAVNLLPTAQRTPFWVMFAKTLLSPVKWLYGVFKGFMNGETFAAYNPLTTYALAAQVQYNFKTYESLKAANTSNQPDISPLWWILRNGSFIGAVERAKYNGRYLQLTWALNREFGTTFRQPPYPSPYGGSGTFSDIYITNTPLLYTPFVVGPTSGTSSFVGIIGNHSLVPVTPTYATASVYDFTINIPVAVYTDLGASADIRKAIVDTFVAKYAVSGTSWTIATY